jgi:hypothetical protein
MISDRFLSLQNKWINLNKQFLYHLNKSGEAREKKSASQFEDLRVN